MKNIYEIKNITLGYTKKNIIEDLSLDIKHQDFVAIIGPNGCGKSTLLKAMARIISPKKGEIKYEGKYVNKKNKLVLFYHLGNLFKIPVETLFFQNKLDFKKPTKEEKLEVKKMYFLSKIHQWANENGFSDKDKIYSPNLEKVDKRLTKLRNECNWHNLEFDKNIYFDPSIIDNGENDDPLYKLHILAQKYNFEKNALIYDIDLYNKLFLNRTYKYLKNKKIKINEDIYFKNKNPFYINELNNNYLKKQLNKLINLAKLFKFKKDDLLFSFDKPYLSSKDFAKKVAFVPQMTSFPSDVTLYEFVAIGRYPHNNIYKKKYVNDDKFIMNAIKNVNLEEFKDKFVEDLSGGQKQRAVIALALCQDTETILLDEPTNHLDIRHQLEIIHLLHDLNHKLKKTIILVIHDINHGMKFSDKIVIMKNGQILSQGETNKVVNKKIIKEVFGVDANVELSDEKKIITDYWIDNLDKISDYHKEHEK